MSAEIQLSQPIIDATEIDAVVRVLRTGVLTQGPEVERFEAEFSEIVAGRHSVAVNSGTSALHLSLLAMGIGAGDEVIVPSFSFAATANAVAMTGATPVFADIDPLTFCVSPDAVAALVTPRTAGLVSVHLYGQAADVDSLNAIADRYSLAHIEDAAQAHGAAFRNRPVGALADMAAFSFYPTKNMTTGEGGMIVTADPSFVRRARLLRNQGMEVRYQNEMVGLNNRMTEVHAAIGRVQLRKLASWNDQRRRNAKFFDENLVGVVTPIVATGARHVYHQYTVRSPSRDLLQERLRTLGIPTGVYYPTPIHRLPAFKVDVELPETMAAARDVLSLPVHPSLSSQDLERIVGGVNG